jgi:hypothetical protein
MALGLLDYWSDFIFAGNLLSSNMIKFDDTPTETNDLNRDMNASDVWRPKTHGQNLAKQYCHVINNLKLGLPRETDFASVS